MLHHGDAAPAGDGAGGERDLGPGVGGTLGAAGAISSTLATFIKPHSRSQLQITTYFLQFIFLVRSQLPLPPPVSTDLAESLQADLEAGLATPGAVLYPGTEPPHQLRLISSSAVQTAGSLGLLCPLPEVALLLVEGCALLLPEREGGLGAVREDTGAPGLRGALTASALQTDPPSAL